MPLISTRSLLLLSLACVTSIGATPIDSALPDGYQCQAGKMTGTPIPFYTAKYFSEETKQWVAKRGIKRAFFYVTAEEASANRDYLKSVSKLGHAVGLMLPSLETVFDLVQDNATNYRIKDLPTAQQKMRDLEKRFMDAIGQKPESVLSPETDRKGYVFGLPDRYEMVKTTLPWLWRTAFDTDRYIVGRCTFCETINHGGWMNLDLQIVFRGASAALKELQAQYLDQRVRKNKLTVFQSPDARDRTLADLETFCKLAEQTSTSTALPTLKLTAPQAKEGGLATGGSIYGTTNDALSMVKPTVSTLLALVLVSMAL